jgi:ribonuclease PH
MRAGGRKAGDLRKIRVTEGYQKHPEGSVLFELGETKVVCAASVEERVPPFLRGTGKGWVTAEYSMLPRATTTRTQREGRTGRVQGRTQEIQRLIGRSLRAVLDLGPLGERTITVDCDILQADGGTRIASINGAWIALWQACSRLTGSGVIPKNPIREPVAAVSVGILGDRILVDLDYAEDSNANVDMNVVMTGSGNLIEVQGTAEGEPFTKDQLDRMLEAAVRAGKRIIRIQKQWMGGSR